MTFKPSGLLLTIALLCLATAIADLAGAVRFTEPSDPGAVKAGWIALLFSQSGFAGIWLGFTAGSLVYRLLPGSICAIAFPIVLTRATNTSGIVWCFIIAVQILLLWTVAATARLQMRGASTDAWFALKRGRRGFRLLDLFMAMTCASVLFALGRGIVQGVDADKLAAAFVIGAGLAAIALSSVWMMLGACRDGLRLFTFFSVALLVPSCFAYFLEPGPDGRFFVNVCLLQAIIQVAVLSVFRYHGYRLERGTRP